ncbi:uncharacterized protein BX663DRAFT_555659 [Cokeromyces recurvatus]|uniref:uncharacterized protein n=1 Tax=Cokeromyces recurvatus TaxID=90255 RepID=UPI0022210FF3|nr:uncharacterized protein BX663DRAFT_555659 [Cokeromyces recurvatus]KAI7898610.1 hypothetical protein BX663DRAFT_555659 [Cokeromyces recurvatus]
MFKSIFFCLLFFTPLYSVLASGYVNNYCDKNDAQCFEHGLNSRDASLHPIKTTTTATTTVGAFTVSYDAFVTDLNAPVRNYRINAEKSNNKNHINANRNYEVPLPAEVATTAITATTETAITATAITDTTDITNDITNDHVDRVVVSLIEDPVIQEEQTEHSLATENDNDMGLGSANLVIICMSSLLVLGTISVGLFFLVRTVRHRKHFNKENKDHFINDDIEKNCNNTNLKDDNFDQQSNIDLEKGNNMNEVIQAKKNKTAYPEKTEVAPPEEKNEVNQDEENNDSAASRFMQRISFSEGIAIDPISTTIVTVAKSCSVFQVAAPIAAAVDFVIPSSSALLVHYPNEDFKNKLRFFENLCSQQQQQQQQQQKSEETSENDSSLIGSMTSFWNFDYDNDAESIETDKLDYQVKIKTSRILPQECLSNTYFGFIDRNERWQEHGPYFGSMPTIQSNIQAIRIPNYSTGLFANVLLRNNLVKNEDENEDEYDLDDEIEAKYFNHLARFHSSNIHL